MKRTFLAIKLHAGNELLTLLDELQQKLSHEQRNINWCRPDQMHLTLKFIGDTPDDDIKIIGHEMRELAHRHKTFDMRFDRVGVFGSNGSPRVLWLGMQNEPQEIYNLADDVLDTFTKIGYPRDRQNFVPHVTLCRIKHLVDKKLFWQFYETITNKTYISTEVKGFSLIQSFLSPAGAHYKTLERFEI